MLLELGEGPLRGGPGVSRHRLRDQFPLDRDWWRCGGRVPDPAGEQREYPGLAAATKHTDRPTITYSPPHPLVTLHRQGHWWSSSPKMVPARLSVIFTFAFRLGVIGIGLIRLFMYLRSVARISLAFKHFGLGVHPAEEIARPGCVGTDDG